MYYVMGNSPIDMLSVIVVPERIGYAAATIALIGLQASESICAFLG